MKESVIQLDLMQKALHLAEPLRIQAASGKDFAGGRTNPLLTNTHMNIKSKLNQQYQKLSTHEEEAVWWRELGQ